MPGIPVSDIDLYTDPARVDPYAIYDELRALGPVVHLSRYDMYALPRYDEVRAALTDWETFSSARGVFVDRDVNAQLEGITLCSDPPEHTAMRTVLGRPLRADRMREVAPRIETEADRVVERVVDQGRCDVVTELAEYLPMTVVSDLVGLPEHGREKMLEWAAAIWNTQGPADERAAAAGPAVEEFMSFAMNDAVPGKIDPDGWAAQLYEAADRGEISTDKCPMMMLDYVTPSLDTTILAIANMVALFAQHPGQWDLLREDRSLIPHAINESLRLETPVPQFSRSLTEDHEIAGVELSAGSRVALLYASANRDVRHYPDPTRFDITRRPSDHLAFGRGEHVCVGMHLARLEMSSLLERLADRVARFEILESRPMINNGLRGFDRLDVAFEPAAA
ncbi:cytochrome P450 [Streptomyces olivaceus]|uniref:cytochrome P450 n=1 Tax=Streptomyces TaxID=1883 RepID=UPI001CCFECDD|nr:MULTISPECIES: cytochrome P450 [Streptomyces]MBZ6141494.1 cytochrome P450 [Streptomyces olivaceus]MBZ6169516.1 cytochrome P450 [Streptomyces olivaceus]MBZ6174512.1 cytochrome P450 [Streptomyces olivaceus]MBZ6180691.1 cytochrome P450 [Streptomyces olivaceus]MBZ6258723.1 cytochrome P450 [Streptomyces olivaceus]